MNLHTVPPIRGWRRVIHWFPKYRTRMTSENLHRAIVDEVRLRMRCRMMFPLHDNIIDAVTCQQVRHEEAARPSTDNRYRNYRWYITGGRNAKTAAPDAVASAMGRNHQRIWCGGKIAFCRWCSHRIEYRKKLLHRREFCSVQQLSLCIVPLGDRIFSIN